MVVRREHKIIMHCIDKRKMTAANSFSGREEACIVKVRTKLSSGRIYLRLHPHPILLFPHKGSNRLRL